MWRYKETEKGGGGREEVKCGKNLVCYQLLPARPLKRQTHTQNRDPENVTTWQDHRHTHRHAPSHRVFSSWGKTKASNLSLSCLSLALIKAYNELGTGSQSQDRWLYGPGQIIALCGLRLSAGENRKRESDGGRGIGGDREGEKGSERGKQRLKFYTPTFEKCFAIQLVCPEFTTRAFFQICAALLTLSRNKCSRFW